MELVLRGVAAAARRPRPDFETINQVFHPDHVSVPIEATKLGEGEVEGAGGYKAWLESVEALMPWEVDVGSAQAIGPSTVVVAIRLRGRGAVSGAAIDQPTWLVVRVEEGRITRTEAHLDQSEALEAADRAA